MIVTIKDGYIDSYAIVGELENGIEVDTPEDMEVFHKNFKAYKLVDNKLILDENKLVESKNSAIIEGYRFLRKQECFPIINRGILWYERLTPEQKEELNLWYQNWLDITITKEVPIKPNWL